MEDELDEFQKFWITEYISVLHELWQKNHHTGALKRKWKMGGNRNAVKAPPVAPESPRTRDKWVKGVGMGINKNPAV
jgi:hypothetical protein